MIILIRREYLAVPHHMTIISKKLAKRVAREARAKAQSKSSKRYSKGRGPGKGKGQRQRPRAGSSGDGVLVQKASAKERKIKYRPMRPNLLMKVKTFHRSLREKPMRHWGNFRRAWQPAAGCQLRFQGTAMGSGASGIPSGRARRCQGHEVQELGQRQASEAFEILCAPHYWAR